MSPTVQCVRCRSATPTDPPVAPGHVRCVHCKALVCLPDAPPTASEGRAALSVPKAAAPPPAPANPPGVPDLGLTPQEDAVVAVLELVRAQGLKDLETYRDWPDNLGVRIKKKDRLPGEKFLGELLWCGVLFSNLRLVWDHVSLKPVSGRVAFSALDPERMQGRNGLFKHTLTLGPDAALAFSGLEFAPRSFVLLSTAVRLVATILKDTALARWRNNAVLTAACPHCSAANGVTGDGLGGSACGSCSRAFQPDLGKVSWGAVAADGLRGTALGVLGAALGTAAVAVAAVKAVGEGSTLLGPAMDAATGRCPHCGSQTSKSHQICPKCGRDKLRPTSYYHG